MIAGNAQVCAICVMDANHPGVEFDETGQCNSCKDAFERRQHEWWPDATGAAKMADLVRRMREQGKGKPYDAMVGLSGGVDSAYLAHLLAAEHGLRLLAVHVDGGWNSEAAVSNIESLVRALDIDLHTKVIEWEEMRDLQLAFLRAGVFNQDFPQDHAFFATLIATARDYGIRTFLSGVNFSSESVGIQAGPSVTAYDGRHLRAIHARFGERPLVEYPVMTLKEYLWMSWVRRQPRVERPLDFVDYDKEKAQDVLRKVYGWRDYGTKHSESRFTKFYQDIYLPRKYFMDKRRLHMSSLIVAGQLSRDEALAQLEKQPVDPQQSERELRFVATKLGISKDELVGLIEAPPVLHTDYPNDRAFHQMLINLRARMRRRGGKRAPA